MNNKQKLTKRESQDIIDSTKEFVRQSIVTWKEKDLPQIIKSVKEKYGLTQFYILTFTEKENTSKKSFNTLVGSNTEPIFDGHYHLMRQKHIFFHKKPPLIPGCTCRYINADSLLLTDVDRIVYVLPPVWKMERYLDPKNPEFNAEQAHWIREFFKQPIPEQVSKEVNRKIRRCTETL